jgi:hypothetical protein
MKHESALQCSQELANWARYIEFTPSQPLSLRYILILSLYLGLGRPSIFTLQFSHSEFFIHSSCLPFVLHAHPSHPPWINYTNNIWWIVILHLRKWRWILRIKFFVRDGFDWFRSETSCTLLCRQTRTFWLLADIWLICYGNCSFT